MSTVIDVTDTSSEQGRPFLKSGAYSVRIIGAEKKNSKAGNPMLEFNYEIVAPETVTDEAGKPVKITGLQLMDWIAFTDKNEGAKKKFRALNEATSQPLKMDIDDPIQVKAYLGKAIRVRLATEGGVLKDENTGEPITKNGQPVTTNQYRIREILGADEQFTIPADAVAY